MKAFFEKIFPLDSSSFQTYLYENEEFVRPALLKTCGI